MYRASLYIGLCLALLSLASCEEDDRISTDLIVVPATASSDEVVTVEASQISFEIDTLDFGTIAAGKIVSHSFNFTNEGNGPLLITNVHTPCGCTAAKSWPKEVILPGGTGVIDVEFNSADRQGHQVKTIDIITNSRPSISRVVLTGHVIGPDHTLEDIK